MREKRTFRSAIILLVLAAWLLPAAATANTQTDPTALVEDTAGRVLRILNDRRDEFTQSPDALREVVREELLPLMDVDYSSRLILGRAGRGASPEQLGAFTQAMSTLLINRYADGLLNFESREQMEVLPLKGKNSEKMTRVRSRIRLANGTFLPVDYAFRMTDEGWKAFDVTVEGISYVITYRNQIAPLVESDGIDKVTADLTAGNLQLSNE